MEKQIEELIRQIKPLDTAAMAACRKRIDNLTKPLGSLHSLEFMAERLAGIQCNSKPGPLRKAIVIFAADHAVDGVENYTRGTKSIKAALEIAQSTGPINTIAEQVQAGVLLVDMGLEKDLPASKGVLIHKIMRGSHFFGYRPAMSEKQMTEALLYGATVAKKLSEEGYTAIGLGNIGERALLSAFAITAVFYRNEMLKLTENIGADKKIEQLETLVKSFDLTGKRPLELLCHAGSPEIAAMTGFILEAAKNRLVIVFDNGVTGSAVLLARALTPQIDSFIYPSAAYDEPVHRLQMSKLQLKPFLRYDFIADQGIGSALGLSILDAAVHMLNDMKTFSETAVAAAEDGPGKGKQIGKKFTDWQKGELR